jgi:putative SOS response-associated peptidase YedK
MCGRFNLKPDGKTEALLSSLGVTGQPRYADDIAPGALISIIHNNKSPTLKTAIWWLFLDRATLKPNYKYTSFNSRSDKLFQPRSISYKPYRESRCIIPASAFVEGLGDRKTYHMIELTDHAIAFGGLFKENVDLDSGEIVYSAAIITLPPVEKWRNIHPKSMPLMLDYKNKELIDKWLDPDFSDPGAFDALLKPGIHQAQRITPIDRPSRWNPVGESYLLT